MKRGFIKWIDGSLRVRFVKAGYDADNLSLHPNLVIFDSGDEGNISLVASGSVTLSGYRTSGTGYVQIVSWSLPFVPVCTFQFSTPTWPQKSPVFRSVFAGGANDGAGGTVPMPSIRVSASGIQFRGMWDFSFSPKDLTIYYQAYRLAVT